MIFALFGDWFNWEGATLFPTWNAKGVLEKRETTHSSICAAEATYTTLGSSVEPEKGKNMDV